MKFKEFLTEGNITIFHGDNHKTTKLDPKLMANGNNQEGIGFYFGDLPTAKDYGKDIVSVTINSKYFVNSRGYVDKELNMKSVQKLYLELHKIDEEPLWYELTDWLRGGEEPGNVQKEDLIFLANKQDTQEVRNLQIDLADKFGVVDFVKTWNKIFKNVKGTFNKELNIWCIIDDKIKVEKYEI